MENKLVMATDLIIALTSLVKEYGDCPVLLSDKDSDNAMVPIKDAHIIEVSKPGITPEKAIMLANFILCEEDGTFLGYNKE